MKILNTLVLLLVFQSAFSQISFNTGNVQLDSDLNSINASASVNIGQFKADLSVGYNVAEKKIDYMSASIGMQPAEIYLALEICKITNRSVDDLLPIYTSHKSQGWGYIAKEMGIKPGSDAFHQLKNNASNKKNNGKSGNKGNGNGNGKSKKS